MKVHHVTQNHYLYFCLIKQHQKLNTATLTPKPVYGLWQFSVLWKKCFISGTQFDSKPWTSFSENSPSLTLVLTPTDKICVLNTMYFFLSVLKSYPIPIVILPFKVLSVRVCREGLWKWGWQDFKTSSEVDVSWAAWLNAILGRDAERFQDGKTWFWGNLIFIGLEKRSKTIMWKQL